MELNIHSTIKNKLTFFLKNGKIPHIIFHGPSGSGKREILTWFINKIYNNDKDNIKSFVLYVNCAHIKGIRFIRDELKYFSKLNIQNKNGIIFKSIILFNADKLTVDAQSALRRCIEQFSHTTRFFIIIENKDKLLNPILSRFCNIFVSYPYIDNKYVNLHIHNKKVEIEIGKKNKNNKIKKIIGKQMNSLVDIDNTIVKLYNKGYSGLDLMEYVELSNVLNEETKYYYLVYFDKIRKQFKNEKLFMSIILYFTFMRKDFTLENIL